MDFEKSLHTWTTSETLLSTASSFMRDPNDETYSVRCRK